MERVGRVFAAVPLPPEMRMALAEQIVPLQIPGRVAPPENWHVTLRFLGSVDQVTYERFLAALDFSAFAPFQLRLGGIGAFPNMKSATVLWVGIETGESELTSLNEVAEEATQASGLEEEERPFHPHLTLARVRPPSDVRGLAAIRFELGWRCDRVVVYRSITGREGARYEPLETMRLGE